MMAITVFIGQSDEADSFIHINGAAISNEFFKLGSIGKLFFLKSFTLCIIMVVFTTQTDGQDRLRNSFVSYSARQKELH